MSRRLIGTSVAVASACILVGYGGTYAAWSHYDVTLASDDFWDRCRNPATTKALGPGRYESIVWSQVNDAGQCEDVLGYCSVYTSADGSLVGDTFEEHQVSRIADASNCTFSGWMFSEKPPFRKVN